ncbi:hypothetical protein Tco_1234230 [Tanacetum coccineum]
MFRNEEHDLEENLEDLEGCREDKANTIIGDIHDKLNNDWFNNTSKDEDDLEGIMNYLEPRLYDGFIDLDDKAYNKRSPSEIYTKVKVLGVDEIPRTRDNIAAIRARLMKNITLEGNGQAKT